VVGEVIVAVPLIPDGGDGSVSVVPAERLPATPAVTAITLHVTTSAPGGVPGIVCNPEVFSCVTPSGASSDVPSGIGWPRVPEKSAAPPLAATAPFAP
jgi:hypothetical protein